MEEMAKAKREAYEKRLEENSIRNAKIYKYMILGSTLKGHLYNLENHVGKNTNEKMAQVSPRIKEAIYSVSSLMEKGTNLQIVGKSGNTRNVAMLIGELWEKEPNESITSVNEYWASANVEPEVQKVLNDFVVARQSISQVSLNLMTGIFRDYDGVYNEWKQDFLRITKCEDSPEEVYKLISETPGITSGGYFANKIQEQAACSKVGIPKEKAVVNADFVSSLLEATHNLEQDGMGMD